MSPNHHPPRKRYLFWIGGLWMAGLAATAVLTYLMYGYQQNRLETRFNTELERISDDIQRRFQTPVYGLMGARGVYAATTTVDRQEFRRYVESRDLTREFPGVRGMGFIERVYRDGLDAFVQSVKADGAPDFTVRSLDAPGPDLYVIKYIEPLATNRVALGLDIGSEAVRREAAERAAQTGRAALSGMIRLVQDNRSRPGFLIFVPVYLPGLPLGSASERLSALQGLTYSPIVLEDLLQPSMDLLRTSGLRIQISDKSIAQGGQSIFETGDAPKQPQLSTEKQLVTNGSTLFIRAQSTPGLDATSNRWLVYAFGTGGALLSTLLCWALWLQVTGRLRAEARAQGMTLDLKKLAMVAEHTANAVLMTDENLIITWVNEGFTRVSGYTADDAVGRKPGELLGSGLADPQTLQKLKDSAEQGVGCRVEILNRAKDGRTYWLDTELQPIRDGSGRLIGFVEIGLDVTQERHASEQLVNALRESEAQKKELGLLARVARETTNAVVLTDSQGLIEWVNEGFTRTTGYTLEDVLGKKPGVVLQCPETDPQTVAQIREAIVQRQPCKVEILNRRKDGRLYWQELEISPLFDGSDQHTGFMAIQSDVTERRAAQDQLNRAIQENESLMSAINQGTIYSVADLQGNILDLNDEFVRISGYSREELIGANHRLLKSGQQSASFWDEAWASISSGQIWRGEVCNRTKRGDLYWVESTIIPCVGLDGMVEKYISIRIDITDKKRSQFEIESQRKRLDNILRGTRAGTWEWHVPSGLTVFNERWAEIAGYTLEELGVTTIDTWMKLTHPDDLKASDDLLRQHFSGEADYYEVEVRMRHRDGHWVWVLDRGQVASREPDGSPGWMYGTHLDITEVVRAKEEALEASRAKGNFLANMSHEIRTPMNAILGMLKLMHNTPLQPRQLDYVAKTESAAKSLLHLLNDILDVSKVEAGKMTLDPQPFGIEQLMRDLSVIFSACLGNKPVEVLFDIDPRVPRELLGDNLRLQQILINLGSNAIKFTSRGEVVLRVRMEGLETSESVQKARLHFSVKDSGIGIAPENQDKIFAGFTQAEASTTRRFGGTGLGLSICRRLIELMGGELSLQSTLGEGSTFSFSLLLPVKGSTGGPGAGNDDTFAPTYPWCTPDLPVLVVDDNPIARQLMEQMGHTLGWNLETVDSGEAALQRIAEQDALDTPYRAVLVDWMMPGLDGWQTSARIRSMPSGSSSSATSPLIMMVTAHGREMLSQQTTEVQSLIDGYLVKPVTAAMLLDAMQAAFQPLDASDIQPSRTSVVRPLAGIRILLVEDNAINQQVAEELLSGQGAVVDIADNGRRGVEAVQAAMECGKPYDAVLMDMQMPVMDGITAAREIRSRLSANDLPIIAMTANAMDSDRVACMAAGMNDHVGKPFDLDRLVAMLLQWTQGASGMQAELVLAHTSLFGTDEDRDASRNVSIDQPALLNREAALKRVGGSTSLLNRLSTQFLADLPRLIQACEPQPSGDEQGLQVQRALHSLKGVAGTIGADALADAAGKAEQQSKSGQPLDRDHLRGLAAKTRLALLEFGVEAPAEHLMIDPAAGNVRWSLNTAQQMILERILDLLNGSDMAVFEALDELMDSGEDEGDTGRWDTLNAEVQSMEFKRAAELVQDWLEGVASPHDGRVC